MLQKIENLDLLNGKELKAYYAKVLVEINKFDMYQNAMKILINSLYGALGELSFRYFETDMAEAITSTGQVMNRYISNCVNNYLAKLFKENSNEFNYIPLGDTDSIYVELNQLVREIKHKNPHIKYSDEEICNMLNTFASKYIEPFLKQSFEAMAQHTNARDNFMHMKREAIAPAVITRAKKNYIMDVLDNEGIRYAHPKLKVTGLESVRSTLPQLCRDALEETYKLMLREESDKPLKAFIKDFRKTFMTAPLEDICGSTGVKGINEKLSSGEDEEVVDILGNAVKNTSDSNNNLSWDKGTPFHVKAAITFNNAIAQRGLKHIKPITDHTKIKLLHLKPNNPFGNNMIAFEDFPHELNLEKYADRQAMWEKYFLKPVESLTDIIGWETKEVVNLDSFFG